jgi:predicted MFS family arabinose efflux permease
MGLHQSFLSPAMPLGAALGGLLLVHFNAPQIIGGAGIVCVIGGVLATFALLLNTKKQR